MDNLLAHIGQLISPMVKKLQSEKGEVIIPFMETVPEASRPSVETLVTNLGATTEELAGFKSFDEFAAGYKPKAPEPSKITSWKKSLTADIANSPTLTKFEDTPEGLGKAMESHLSLEKLLGHDKVPIPKDDKDVEGWQRFNKAMGIPDKPDGYGLEDAKIPESMKAMSFDKAKFAEVVHANHLTPAQAKGLWSAYTQLSLSVYQNAVKKQEEMMSGVVNSLRAEWGDTYDTNVELGQTVINKFSGDEETEKFLSASLIKDPRYVKFLAKIGQQFSENKIGDFSVKRFSMTPEQAQEEIDKIRRDSNHPYLNPKATPAEHQRAVEYVDSLYAVINKAKGKA